jgi:putative inorganic carbon (hco3(-)) transporter
VHFGLTAYAPYLLYALGIMAVLLSVFWRPIAGIYYLAPMIPLQTVRYWMNDLPLGQQMIDIVVLAVIVGLIRRGERPLPKTPLNWLLLPYGIYTYVSLCWGSLYLQRPLPLSPYDPRLAFWKSYMTMPLLLYLVTAAVRDRREIRILILLMCLAVFALDRSLWETVSQRDYSQYSEDLREEGSLGYAGVNGLAAFEAQSATLLLALAGFERRPLRWLAYMGLATFSALCLMYSFSRGGYAAFLAGWLFIAVLRQRKLLVLLVVFLMCWTSVVPNAVRERVDMTYGGEQRGPDPSAETRMMLWNDALHVANENPLFGTGFNTYAYMGRVGSYEDTHNIYLKMLVETGVVGLALFLLLLWKLGRLGWRAFRRADDPLMRSLGLGLTGWLVCTAVANFFGDRWTFLQVNGYLWMVAGCVCRGLALQQDAAEDHVVPVVGHEEVPLDLFARGAA